MLTLGCFGAFSRDLKQLIFANVCIFCFFGVIFLLPGSVSSKAEVESSDSTLKLVLELSDQL